MKFAFSKSTLALLRHQCRRSLHQRSCWCWTTRPGCSDCNRAGRVLSFASVKRKVPDQSQTSDVVSCLQFSWIVVFNMLCSLPIVRVLIPAHPCAAKEWNAQFAMSASWEDRGRCWKKTRHPAGFLSRKVFTEAHANRQSSSCQSWKAYDLSWNLWKQLFPMMTHDVGLYSPTANEAKLELAVRSTVLARVVQSVFKKASSKFNLRVFWSKVPFRSFQ